jgi:hypothetical protein
MLLPASEPGIIDWNIQQLLKKTSQNRVTTCGTVALGDWTPPINGLKLFLHAVDLEKRQYGPTPYRFLQLAIIRL